MKKISIISIIGICLSLLIGSLIFAYFVTDKKLSEKPLDEKDNIVKEQSTGNEDDIDNTKLSVYEGEYVTPNTIIEVVEHYKKCNHTIKKEEELSDNMINMEEEEFVALIKNDYPRWKLNKFSRERIIINVEKDHLCVNHFIVGETDGKIAIFKISEEGERVLDKILKDDSILMLKKIDQEKLKDGIVVDSEEEIPDILEDFIS